MQPHLSLVLIPFFILLLHFEEALERRVVAVSADCNDQDADGDKLLDAITVLPANIAILTTTRLLEGLKCSISLFHQV